jgi:hypothetical protein
MKIANVDQYQKMHKDQDDKKEKYASEREVKQ